MNAKLTDENVATIRRSGLPDKLLAKHYGVARLAILRARTGQTFHHVKVKPSLRSSAWNTKNLTKEK